MKIGERCERCSSTENLFGINGRTYCVGCCDFGIGKALAPVKEALTARTPTDREEATEHE